MSFRYPPKPKPGEAAAFAPNVPRHSSITESQVLRGANKARGREPKPTEASRAPVPLTRRVVVVTSARDYTLRQRTAFVGNSAACDVRVPGPDFPAMRARLQVTERGVTVEQVSGSTPLLVNGHPITGRRRLHDGDRLLFASQEVFIFQGDLRSEYPTRPRPREQAAPSEPPESVIRRMGPYPEPSLARAAEKLLALGRAGEAELLLQEPLTQIRERAQETRTLPDDVLDWAARCALLLARDMRRPAWFDYAVEIHLLAQRRMNPNTLRRLQVAQRGIKGNDRLLLATYKQVLGH